MTPEEQTAYDNLAAQLNSAVATSESLNETIATMQNERRIMAAELKAANDTVNDVNAENVVLARSLNECRAKLDALK